MSKRLTAAAHELILVLAGAANYLHNLPPQAGKDVPPSVVAFDLITYGRALRDAVRAEAEAPIPGLHEAINTGRPEAVADVVEDAGLPDLARWIKAEAERNEAAIDEAAAGEQRALDELNAALRELADLQTDIIKNGYKLPGRGIGGISLPIVKEDPK